MCKDTAISLKHRIKAVKTTKFKGVNGALLEEERHKRKKKEIFKSNYQTKKTRF